MTKDTWHSTPLIELLETLETGSRPKGGVAQITDGVPSIGGEHLDSKGGFRFHNLRYVPHDFFAEMTRGRINKQDILVVKDGATTGKTSFVSDHFPFETATINEHVFLLRPCRKKVLPRFLFYYLYSSGGQQQILSCFQGAAIGGIPQGFARTTQVPVLPLHEQKHIVAILDAAEELQRLRELADRRTADLIPALFHEMFGDPDKNTKRWQVKALAQVAELTSGGTPSKENPAFWNGAIPWLSAKDMKASEAYDAEDHITELALEKTTLKKIPANQILVVVRGMILAHTLPLCITRVPVTINQDLKAIMPDEKIIDSEYLLWTLMAFCPLLLAKVSSAGHGTKKLDVPRLIETPVPIPPLPLQCHFANRVAGIRAMEANQSTSRRRLNDLFQSLLHRAFRGDL